VSELQNAHFLLRQCGKFTAAASGEVAAVGTGAFGLSSSPWPRRPSFVLRSTSGLLGCWAARLMGCLKWSHHCHPVTQYLAATIRESENRRTQGSGRQGDREWEREREFGSPSSTVTAIFWHDSWPHHGNVVLVVYARLNTHKKCHRHMHQALREI